MSIGKLFNDMYLALSRISGLQSVAPQLLQYQEAMVQSLNTASGCSNA